jgi:colicin import membrane protein
MTATLTTPDCLYTGCYDPIERTGRPGRPSRFCADPDHNNAALLALNQKGRQRAERAAARHAPITRAVSDRTESLAAVVRRLEEVAQELLPALLADAAELIGALADPGAVAAEIAHVRRDCDEQVRAAEEARADAELRADRAERDRDDALAVQELAEGAAEEAGEQRDQAVEELDLVTAATRKAVDQMQAQLAAAQTAQALAESERDAAKRTASACTDEVRELRKMLEEQRRTHQLRMDEAHTAHAKSMAAAHAAADQVIDNERGRHESAMAAARADADKIRTELREDLRKALDELNSRHRTGEFTDSAEAAQNGRKGLRSS